MTTYMTGLELLTKFPSYYALISTRDDIQITLVTVDSTANLLILGFTYYRWLNFTLNM